MKSTLTKKTTSTVQYKGTTNAYPGVAVKKSIIYYMTDCGNMCVLEIPDDVDLNDVSSVLLHLGKSNTQTCHFVAKPAMKGLYTLVSEGFKDLGYNSLYEMEMMLKKQLNLGTYEYTVNAAKIQGD